MESSKYPIKTVVVLVQENRSFDHMLGWMKSLNPEIDGVTGKESNPLSTTAGDDHPDSNRIYFGEQSENVEPDPGHSFEATYEQVFGLPWNKEDSSSSSSSSSNNNNVVATMEGFARQAESIQKGMSEIVMNGFRPDKLPVFKELITEFAVCDRWFSSAPTLTQPNRLFIHSATSYGSVTNDTKMLIQGYPQKTIFESLEDSGFSFGIYYQYPPTTLFFRNLRKLRYIKRFHQFDLEFKRDCKEGKLPNYVVIEQRYFETNFVLGNDDHPPHDVSEGQRFVKEVYETLRSSPQWSEILFIIIYDEHGGFFDHVPTPVNGIPSPDDIVSPQPHNFKFDRLGVRVPAILISPWIKRGTVLHRPSGPYPTSEFEHSSIPATVKKIFNLKEFLTKRDAWAGTFENIVTSMDSPRTDCPVELPEPIRLRSRAPEEDSKLSDFQEELVLLAAALKGEQYEKKKDVLMFEDKSIFMKKMRVFEAANYVGIAFQKFMDESENALRNGADDSHIVVPAAAATNEPRMNNGRHKTWSEKIFSCLVCDN